MSEQSVYARWVDAGARLGLAALAAAFVAYVFGVLDSHVPREQLPVLWTLPLEEFLARANAPAGWDWLALAGKGDYLTLGAVSLLALATLVCYVRLVIFFFARGQMLHGYLAAAQVLVLLAAASGLAGGSH